MQRLAWSIAIAVLGVALLGLVLLLRSPPPSYGGAAARESRPPPGRARPERPPAMERSAAPDAMSSPDRGSTAGPGPERDAPPARSSGPGQEPAEIRDRLETTFQASAVVMQSDLSRTLARELPRALPPGSEIRQIECRAFCRIETAHPNADAFQEFMNRTIRAQSGALVTGPIFAAPLGAHDPGRPLVAVVYVAEYGAELPLRIRH